MLEQILESLLFTSDEPLEVSRVLDFCKEIAGIEQLSEASIIESLQRLEKKYITSDHVFRIVKWGGGYRLITSEEMAPFLKAFYSQRDRRKLSKSLLETVAVIAYKQPVTRSEIEYVRGVDADYAVRKLLELELIDVIGRSDALGRPLLYGTTNTFLTFFGIGSLEDLPSMREIEELLDDETFNREQAALLLRTGPHKVITTDSESSQT